ncbi:MAG TPA: GGDEF domain-containing protein [Terracidiphilus sp.]|nr:GGDEF domain-containing protein [Terracidiphilus sp.]
MLDWTKLPDLVAVALLTCAFASVARRGQKPVSRLWLTGWVLIAVHFAAFMFLAAPGAGGIVAADLGLASLAAAGVLFAYASIPYRHERSSRWMLSCLLLTNSLYICALVASPALDWALTPLAFLFGVGPLLITVVAMPKFRHILRWMLVALNCGLSAFLLAVQHRPGNGGDVALDAVLFAVYLSCTLHFWAAYRRASTGAFITIAGFLTWASVFVVAPCMESFYPGVHIESEVWNLPKYVVAVGMILLLLEDQIAHNKYLAFHDELTGLPNRRLFQDRLSIALERARRGSAKAALLVIDLDHFKQVNDTWGHHAGDLLLQHVSMLFVGRVRTCDTVARTGGDEFSVILEDLSSVESAYQVAEALVHNLDEPVEIAGKSISIGASIGVAVYPDDAVELEPLCIAADMRMYDEKNVVRSLKSHPLGKVQPQSVLVEDVQPELRVAPESYGA